MEDVFQYWILGALMMILEWYGDWTVPDPKKGGIKQDSKSKNGNAEMLLKISNQLPFRIVLTNSGRDYKHDCERAEITRAVLMSNWREKVFTCMRQGIAVWLPGKNM